MTFDVLLTFRANQDVESILGYIGRQSRKGAGVWHRRLTEVFVEIADSPFAYGLAPENEDHDDTIRQAIFKTRKGLPYRAIFIVRKKCVFILNVRGSGQPNLDRDEIRVPAK